MVRKKKRTNIVDQAYAAIVVRLREERGWSQSALAERYGPNGCAQSHISQLEIGYRGFGPETQENLAKAFGIEVKELWGMARGELGSEEEVLWEMFNELESGERGPLLHRVMALLAEGPPEAVHSLESFLEMIEKTIKGRVG